MVELVVVVVVVRTGRVNENGEYLVDVCEGGELRGNT